MADRPVVITIIGGLEFLLGLFILFGFIAIGLMGTTLMGMKFEGLAAGAIAGIICGGIPMVIGYGMLKGWGIMWWLGIIFNVLSVIGGIITFPVGLIGTLISVIIIYYLTRPGVKQFFGI